ncbi:hypothetical protein LY76DRAFT_593556 [Colletotrichum caudatum]|nr:hypothetical protein LY76DRAFT_593556 [Colletotrichum caudatum]
MQVKWAMRIRRAFPCCIVYARRRRAWKLSAKEPAWGFRFCTHGKASPYLATGLSGLSSTHSHLAGCQPYLLEFGSPVTCPSCQKDLNQPYDRVTTACLPHLSREKSPRTTANSCRLPSHS